MDTYIRRAFLLACRGVVAACLIGCAVLVICDMVFVRYVLNQNTIWQTDFVTYSHRRRRPSSAAPYVLLTRGHVNVDDPAALSRAARALLARASHDR